MGKNKVWNKKVSKQISVHKGKGSLLEINNCMKTASPWFPWHMHAEGMEDEEGTSLIRFVMVDYSKGKKSVSVYANVAPEYVKYFFVQMLRGVEEFSFSQQKIFQKSPDSLEGAVTYFMISRHEYNSSGEKRNYPWYVEIQNGTGIVEKTRNGGQHCKKGTYEVKKRAAIYMTDIDIFVLFCRADSVIKAFERDALFHQRDIQNLQKLFKKLVSLLVYGEQESQNAA